MADPRFFERELKIEVPADFVVPELSGFEALCSSASVVMLRAVYWDTPELVLASWGHTLRSRSSEDGAEHGWTLKLAAGSSPVAERREIEVDGEHDTPPLATLDIVRGLIGHRSMVPVAGIDTTRRRLRLRHIESGATVELDDDLVTSTVAGVAGPSFREIEIELLGGDPAVLDEAGKALHHAGADRPDPTPKLLRVLADRLPAPPLGLGRGRPRTASDLVRSAIAGGFRQLLLHDPTIRLNGDVEAVHQARVATRRLRSNLKTLSPLVDPFRLEGLRRELAWLGTILGEVRDRDVLATTLARCANGVIGYDADAVEIVLGHLRRERERHLHVLLDVLRSSRYHGLVADLTRLAGQPPLRADVEGDAPARDAARQLGRAAYKRLERKIDRLPRHPAPSDLHAVRKTAKQARYAAELVAPLAKGKTDRLARSLAKLQDHLGDKQDDATLAGWLQGLPFDELGAIAAFTAGQLAQEVARPRAEAPTDWRLSWEAVHAAHERSWLA